MNTLFSKMQETFGDIKYTLATFIPQGCVSSSDPLYEAKTIINELADIYKFKKTIELDASKLEVYRRITDILKLKYDLKHFAFYEINNITNQRKIFYKSDEDSLICKEKVNQDATDCRAYRTKSVTISSEFPNLCSGCISSDKNYICIRQGKQFLIIYIQINNYNYSYILFLVARSTIFQVPETRRENKVNYLFF